MSNYEKLVHLLGRKIDEHMLNQLKREFDFLPKNEATKRHVEGGFKTYRLANKKAGISIELMGRKRYLAEYLNIANEENTPIFNEHDLMLSELTIHPPKTNKDLLFGLKTGFSFKQITEALGKTLKYYEFMEGFRISYLDGNYRVILALEENLILTWMRVRIISLEKHRAIERRKNLGPQNQFLIKDNAQKILDFTHKKPTIIWDSIWKEMLEEKTEEEKDASTLAYYQNEFEFIEKVDPVFDKFLLSVSKFLSQADAKGIYESTQRFIEELNALNEIYGSIQTTEREDICDFIDNVVRTTGFKVHPDADITYEWREW